MFSSTAMAQTAAPGAGAPSGGPMDTVIQFAPFLLLIVLFYFLMIRPQQKRATEHRAMVAAVKKGDTVEMNNGMIGRVTDVGDSEATVEIARGVEVKVVKSMLSNVRAKGVPAAANDVSLKK